MKLRTENESLKSVAHEYPLVSAGKVLVHTRLILNTTFKLKKLAFLIKRLSFLLKLDSKSIKHKSIKDIKP